MKFKELLDGMLTASGIIFIAVLYMKAVILTTGFKPLETDEFTQYFFVAGGLVVGAFVVGSLNLFYNTFKKPKPINEVK